MKHHIYNPELRTTNYKVINNFDYCTSAKYDRNPTKPKLEHTETPSTTIELNHVDTYVNNKKPFIIFIDQFSKFAIHIYLADRINQNITQKIREFLAIKGSIKKLVFDKDFNTVNVRNFLEEANIEYRATKHNSHTRNSGIERLNNTLSEKIYTQCSR